MIQRLTASQTKTFVSETRCKANNHQSRAKAPSRHGRNLSAPCRRAGLLGPGAEKVIDSSLVILYWSGQTVTVEQEPSRSPSVRRHWRHLKTLIA